MSDKTARRMDISLAQGYWYGRPLPADTFSAWLKQQPDEMKARKKQ